MTSIIAAPLRMNALAHLPFVQLMVVFFLLMAHKAQAAVAASIRAQGNDAVLNWPSQPGATYVIQQNATLDPGSWQTLATNLGANISGTNKFVLTNIVAQWPSRFFRVS